jgi:hypothetical protein
MRQSRLCPLTVLCSEVASQAEPWTGYGILGGPNMIQITSAASMSCISLCHNKRRFLTQIEELILLMKVHENHNMAFLSRICKF